MHVLNGTLPQEIIKNFNLHTCKTFIDFCLLESAFVYDLKTFSISFLVTFAANFDEYPFHSPIFK